MQFTPRNTNVMVLEPVDAEAQELAKLEKTLAKEFENDSSYILMHTKDLVSRRSNYSATGVKRVYKHLVDTNPKRGRTKQQHNALKQAAAFIKKFDPEWKAKTPH